MNSAQAQAEKLKEFKTKYTKENIQTFFGSTQKAIAFFEMEYSTLKQQQKEYSKKMAKGVLLDSALKTLEVTNAGMKKVIDVFFSSVTAEFNDQAQLLEAQIEFLKSSK